MALRRDEGHEDQPGTRFMLYAIVKNADSRNNWSHAYIRATSHIRVYRLSWVELDDPLGCPAGDRTAARSGQHYPGVTTTMSGPIVRKYGFPNFEKIFGERPLEHGLEEGEATADQPTVASSVPSTKKTPAKKKSIKPKKE
jgi:hypothetical protein